LVLGAFTRFYYIPAMPTYEYICEKCGDHFEISQSISAKALTTCPKEKCTQKVWGKGKVKRAISGGAGLIFKGSGFYITDYRSEKYKEAAKKESGAATSASGETKSASGGEAKPATKAADVKPAKPTKKE
jgi:putative FmdB family regulatory protein